MILSNLSIKRPVFCSVISLLIVVLGLIYFNKLELRGSPNVTPPVITINSYFAGANAKFMERNVTNTLELEMKSLNSLDFMTSRSEAELSSIALIFKLDTDLNQALNDVRSKISEASRQLPRDMVMPTASKVDLSAQPSFWIAISSSEMNDMELTDLVKTVMSPALERLEAVGTSKIYGMREYSIKISPDPLKLFAADILPTAIENAVKSQTQDYPAGIIKTEAQDFVLKLNNTANTPNDFKNITIKAPNRSPVRIGDIADVYYAPRAEEVFLRYNGNKAITIGLIKQSESNTIQVSDQARELLPQLLENLPDHVTIDIAYDASTSVKQSIYTVYKTIAEAVLFVSIIIFLFLGKIRITMIPLLTIPISLIGTFAVMHFLGFSINMFSLLAMVLAIGLVVDDAIVMLENIYRHCENGMSAIDASFKAVKEIGFAVVAMTITLSAVFLPIGMMEGFIGKLFIEFAWTLAFAILISGLVALTLTPMLSSKMLSFSDSDETPQFIQKFSDYIRKLQDKYLQALLYVLSHTKFFALLCIAGILTLIVSFKFVDKTFTPEEDDGILFINGRGPEGSTLDVTYDTVRQAEAILENTNDIHGYFTISGFMGSNSFGAFVPLTAWNTRDRSHIDIKNEIQPKMQKLPAMNVRVSKPGSQFSGGDAIEFHIITQGTFDNLDAASQQIVKRMDDSAIFDNADRELHTTIPTLDIIVNNDKAALYSLPMEEIGRTVQYVINGRKVGTFQRGNEIYDVILEYNKNANNNVGALQKIYLPNALGHKINLSTITDINETVSVDAYSHYNNSLSVKITSDLAENHTLEDADLEIQKLKKEILDPNIYTVKYDGDLERMADSNANMLLTFLYALIIIYLVLAAQFESFIDPLLIMLAVPFSMTGGVASLLIFGDSLNLYSNIGLITLVGLVTKNSIMLVEFANQLREQGKNGMDAILESARLRFRPIIMTTIATMAGAFPLVLTTGAGAAASTSIGIVIVGGTAIGTLFTMFVIPFIYSKRYKT